MSVKLCHRRSTCRLCGYGELSLLLSLTPTPPANAFLQKSMLGESQERFPLDLFFCKNCHHVQLLDVVNPDHLFSNYLYVSGTSPGFVKHFEIYANSIVDQYVPDVENKLVIDIGSNDGTLLRHFKALGFQVLGIDPASEIAKEANLKGIETKVAFFDSQLARQISSTHGLAQVICANNVFAHADNLSEIVIGVRELLRDDGVFIFEVSYLADVFTKTLFDTIYHEHLAYHSVGPLIPFFKAYGMELINVERVDTHGGSLRAAVQLEGGPHKKRMSVHKHIALETKLGIDNFQNLQSWSEKIEKCKKDLILVLDGLKLLGNSIAAYGAAAKATTLMYHFNIGPDVINYIVDDSPLKQGLYSPGLHIPILPPTAIYEKRPDAIVILAWNFSMSIMKEHSKYLDLGGKFIVPLPEVKVY